VGRFQGRESAPPATPANTAATDTKIHFPRIQ